MCALPDFVCFIILLHKMGHAMRSTMAAFFAFGFHKSYTSEGLHGTMQRYAWQTYTPDQQRWELPWRSNMQITARAGNGAIFALGVDPVSLRSRFYTTSPGRGPIWGPPENSWAPFSCNHSLTPTSLIHSGNGLDALDLYLPTTMKVCIGTKKNKTFDLSGRIVVACARRVLLLSASV